MQGHRKTEQDDELTEEHSIAQQANREENPYRRPRQPAQEQPEEERREDERKPTGY